MIKKPPETFFLSPGAGRRLGLLAAQIVAFQLLGAGTSLTYQS